MTSSRRGAAALCAVLAAAGCAARGPAAVLQPANGVSAAQYRGFALDDDGSKHRFRAWIFAAEPDRFHLEISGPVGGTQWIVDSGGGRLAATWVPEAVAFVGAAGAEPMEKIVGVRAGAGDLVGALLQGRPIGGVDSMERRPAAGEGYPEMLEIRRGGRALRLERVSMSTVPVGSRSTLGTGEPPAGIPRRPLEDIPAATSPLASPGGRS